MTKKIIFSKKDELEIVGLYNSGMSSLKISKMFKVSSPTIMKVLNIYGVMRSVGEASIKYDVNVNYFKVIDTEEKAYWLGFLYADGCVTKRLQFKMTLKREDEKHLQSFLNEIESNSPITREVKSMNNKDYSLSTISVRRNEFCKNLIDKGCTYGKTKTLDFPKRNILPEHLVNHFVRGYFDGDGSLTVNHVYKGTNRINYKISIAGTFEILTAIKTLLGKKDLKLHNRNSFYVLDIVGNKQILDILDNFIYKDANIFLERKYQKYMGIKEYHHMLINK